jgi:hypothetical protein
MTGDTSEEPKQGEQAKGKAREEWGKPKENSRRDHNYTILYNCKITKKFTNKQPSPNGN